MENIETIKKREFIFSKYRVGLHVKEDEENIKYQKPDLDKIIEYLKQKKKFDNICGKKEPYRYYNYVEFREKTMLDNRLILVTFKGGVDEYKLNYYNYKTSEETENLRGENQIEGQEQHLLFVESETNLFCYRTFHSGVMHHRYFFNEYREKESELIFDICAMKDITDQLKGADFKEFTEEILEDKDGNIATHTTSRKFITEKATKNNKLDKNKIFAKLSNRKSDRKYTGVIIRNGVTQVFNLEKFQEKWMCSIDYNYKLGCIIDKDEVMNRFIEYMETSNNA